MDKGLLDQVRQIAADVFGIPLAIVSPDSSPDTIDTWDSIAHLNFVLALEQRFGLQLEPEEIEEMLSVGKAAMLVRR